MGLSSVHRRRRRGPARLVAVLIAALAAVALAAEPALAADYTVQRGDTLSEIAARAGTSWRYVWSLNPQIKDPDRLLAGSRLRLPEPDAASGPLVRPGMAQPPAGERYVVRPGESLARIAQRHGLTWAELWLLNPEITNPHRLRPGTVIRLPDWPASAARQASVTAYGPTGRRTASGKVPAQGMAASNTLPFGTVVHTSAGFSVVVEDRIGCCSDLDVFMPSEAEAQQFGRQQLRIWW